MSTLPAALQRQNAEADAAIAAMSNGEQPVVIQDASQVSFTAQPAPATAPVAPPTQPPAAPAEPAKDTWEQRYKSLQGMFNAQVPSLQQRLRELEQENQRLKQPPPQQPAAAPEPPKSAASPKEVEAFGAEMIEMVERRIQDVFAYLSHPFKVELGRIDGRVAQLEQALNGVSQQTGATREDLFFAELGRQVPDYRDINTTDAFLEWLAEVDPVYGAPRQAALDHARAQLDPNRAAAVFKAFVATQRPAAPAPRGASLESQVAPSSAGSAAPPGVAPVAHKRIWTQQAVTKFFMDVHRGNYRGREAEAKALEAEINLAAQENRIK